MTLHITLAFPSCIPTVFSLSSSIRYIMEIIVLRHSLRAIKSTLEVLNAVSVCRFNPQHHVPSPEFCSWSVDVCCIHGIWDFNHLLDAIIVFNAKSPNAFPFNGAAAGESLHHHVEWCQFPYEVSSVLRYWEHAATVNLYLVWVGIKLGTGYIRGVLRCHTHHLAQSCYVECTLDLDSHLVSAPVRVSFSRTFYPYNMVSVMVLVCFLSLEWSGCCCIQCCPIRLSKL